MQNEEHTDTQAEQETKPKLSRLERLERQKAQIENKIKAIQARESEKARKVRTRHLVQIGAIAVKYLKLPDTISPSEFEGHMKQIVVALQQQAKPTEPSQTPLAPKEE